MKKQDTAIIAAFLTPVFMGLAPIFGKLALGSGLDAFTLSAYRTMLAAAVLWAVYLIFFRQYLFIFPAGLLGTLVVGAVNGLGSLLYYNGLLLLNNASMAQLLNMLYVIFSMLMARAIGGSISRMSVLRGAAAFVAVYLITASALTGVDGVQWIGAGLMVGGAFLYALHVILSQRVMFEMPAPTMALYAMTWMGVTVVIARVVYGMFYPLPVGPAIVEGWWYIGGMMLVTAVSRVALFSGVRQVGSVQAVLFNMAELAVTLLVAFIWLGERLSMLQWAGVLLLAVSVLMARYDPEISRALRPAPGTAESPAFSNLPDFTPAHFAPEVIEKVREAIKRGTVGPMP